MTFFETVVWVSAAAAAKTASRGQFSAGGGKKRCGSPGCERHEALLAPAGVVQGHQQQGYHQPDLYEQRDAVAGGPELVGCIDFDERIERPGREQHEDQTEASIENRGSSWP